MHPVAIAAAYLVINLALTIRIVRDEAAGRVPPPNLVAVSRVLRYGPPLLGLLYLIWIAEDWAFFGFVAGFFLLGFYLLDRALNFPERPPPRQ